MSEQLTKIVQAFWYLALLDFLLFQELKAVNHPANSGGLQ